MKWTESKVSRKRRKKVEFELTLLAGKAKLRGIGLIPVGSRSKKREDKAIRSHMTDRTDASLDGGKKEFHSPAALAHEKQMHHDLVHPILLICKNCGLEGLQSEWVKRGENKQSKTKLRCPRCKSAVYSKSP